ncbi:unnamed protein product [Arctia plantaginis]|uniref:Uncharacterized protein n=1 Tax=Arctia plantaginis TaxID=874455 RepID=A0A8S0Z561_ARCPL|nr:unnamed protein product [Arctia plantaginis]
MRYVPNSNLSDLDWWDRAIGCSVRCIKQETWRSSQTPQERGGAWLVVRAEQVVCGVLRNSPSILII